ncbi:hypothetical protein MN608_11128 [Microdochium nivale]|nr:hypothetical protein MN608_11128 [Microdochium nivale]
MSEMDSSSPPTLAACKLPDESDTLEQLVKKLKAISAVTSAGLTQEQLNKLVPPIHHDKIIAAAITEAKTRMNPIELESLGGWQDGTLVIPDFDPEVDFEKVPVARGIHKRYRLWAAAMDDIWNHAGVDRMERRRTGIASEENCSWLLNHHGHLLPLITAICKVHVVEDRLLEQEGGVLAAITRASKKVVGRENMRYQKLSHEVARLRSLISSNVGVTPMKKQKKASKADKKANKKVKNAQASQASEPLPGPPFNRPRTRAAVAAAAAASLTSIQATKEARKPEIRSGAKLQTQLALRPSPDWTADTHRHPSSVSVQQPKLTRIKLEYDPELPQRPGVSSHGIKRAMPESSAADDSRLPPRKRAKVPEQMVLALQMAKDSAEAATNVPLPNSLGSHTHVEFFKEPPAVTANSKTTLTNYEVAARFKSKMLAEAKTSKKLPSTAHVQLVPAALYYRT